MNFLLETKVMPYALIVGILNIVSICVILTIIIVKLTTKDNNKFSKLIVGIVFILFDILLLFSSNEFQKSLSVENATSDLSNWFAFLAIIINFILTTLFFVVINIMEIKNATK